MVKRLGLFVIGFSLIVVIIQVAIPSADGRFEQADATPEKRPFLIVAGLDSLTNGALTHKTKSRYLDTLIPQMHKTYGDGGPGYVPFDSIYFKQDHHQLKMSRRLKEINDLEPGQYPSQYSFDLKGLYTNKGRSDWLRFDLKKDWTYGRVFYLQQPDGGSFKIGYRHQKFIQVDTGGSLSLKTIELPKHVQDRQVVIRHISGKVTLFGGIFLKNGGVAVSRIGQGGDLLRWHAQLNNAFMKQWLQQLKPDLLIFNGGTNDRYRSSVGEFRRHLRHYLKPFEASKCQILINAPNAVKYKQKRLLNFIHSMKAYAKQHNDAFISNQKVLGNTFQEAQQAGYMGDWVHPNHRGTKKIGNQLFFYIREHVLPSYKKEHAGF
ncbi:SGNH/GDSL hydrolase family protein [Tuberibacillus sp. Marseille-P3662]|uniref:SGNH/GDSL hydrolase family protein n=1 Tax=Tuberibacillus sp. Marseille-P3662 TaxID=1965358 RepID=UPI00159312C9|nr:GDSL-type esterase/lipase family protein [Tuberibacillus sp. Marseille-P3662]